jgi:hypothetical protein
MATPFDLGHLIEGIVEQDPMTDRYVIRTEDAQGRPVTFDVQAALAKVKGKEVRLTLATFENLQKLAEMVEKQGNGQVHGIYPDDIVPNHTD